MATKQITIPIINLFALGNKKIQQDLLIFEFLVNQGLDKETIRKAYQEDPNSLYLNYYNYLDENIKIYNTPGKTFPTGGGGMMHFSGTTYKLGNLIIYEISPEENYLNWRSLQNPRSDASENGANDLIFALLGFGPALFKGITSLGKSTISGGKLLIKDISEKGAKVIPSRILEFAGREVPRTAVGLSVETAANIPIVAATGKTWNENVTDILAPRWGETPAYWFAASTNPFFWRGYLRADYAERAAFYNQVTPFGYDDKFSKVVNGTWGKNLEFKAFLKDIPYYLTHNYNFSKAPAWMNRITNSPGFNRFDRSIQGAGGWRNDFLLNARNDALAIALKFKPLSKIFVKTGPNQYSYNLNYLNKHPEWLSDKYFDYSTNMWKVEKADIRGNKGFYDPFSGTHGEVDMRFNNDGTTTMLDWFDINPWEKASHAPNFTLGGYNLSKPMTRFFKDTEVYRLAGGRPWKNVTTFTSSPFSSYPNLTVPTK